MTTATTALEYRDRYKAALDEGTLTQAAWHTERDGRQLACALGVIGDDVDAASKCPAAIMPRWLAQMVPAFFDRQKQADALAWGLAFTEQLARLDGKVPFSVIHDWHANTVCPLGIAVAEKLGRVPTPHKVLQSLHMRALAGEKVTAAEWQPVLKTANAAAYADATGANANVYAAANAAAKADAYANAYANAYAYADAYAAANAYAYANANAGANVYADATGANANVYADAAAYAWKMLADGMVSALANVENPDG